MGGCSSHESGGSSKKETKAANAAQKAPEVQVLPTCSSHPLPPSVEFSKSPVQLAAEATEVDGESGVERYTAPIKLDNEVTQTAESLPNSFTSVNASTETVSVTIIPPTPRIQFAELYGTDAHTKADNDNNYNIRPLPFVLHEHNKGMMRIERTKRFAAFCLPNCAPSRSADNDANNAVNTSSASPTHPKTFNRQASRKIVYLRNTLKKLSMMDLCADFGDESPVDVPSPVKTSVPITSPLNPNEVGASLLSLENSCDMKMCSMCHDHQLQGLSCLCSHFLCTECFCCRVRDMCLQPEILRKHDFAIFCPVQECRSPPWNSYHVRKLLDGPTLQLYLDALVDVCRAGPVAPNSPHYMSPGKQRLRVGSEDHSGKYLLETAEVLRTQLRRLNVTPMEYIPLPEIRAELQGIFDKLNNDMPYDEKRMDYLLMCMENNPIYCAEKEETARQWRAEMDSFTAECLTTMRGYVPVHIFEATLQSLQENDGLNAELAKRLLVKKCLWLVRMSVVDIERIHEVELMGRFNPIAQNLDIVELAAVYAAVPERFANDPSGRKAQWRLNLENALRDMDKLRQTKSLVGAKARHPCYKKQPTAPFLHRHTLKRMEAVKSSLDHE